MFNYKVGKYTLRLLDKENKEEVLEVQRLRYNDLLREFNPSLEEDKLDDDGYDKYAESIIVVDDEKNIIVGTYRLASFKTGFDKLMMENEFDITSLKETNEKILELGRAVVKKEYRDGSVINLLWSGLFKYAILENCRFLLGTCSLHGCDPSAHKETLSYLKKNKMSPYYLPATHNSFEYYDLDIDDKELEDNIPSLLKAYLKLGAKVGSNGYIDYSFNSCDVLIVVDVNEVNKKYIDFYTRIFK